MTNVRASEGDSYDDLVGASGAANVKWNGVALVGRQAALIVSSLVLARLLGPGPVGVVAQASVFITFTTLLLDQGLTAALISERTVSRRLAGAAATVNLALAIVLIAITVPLSPVIASFLNTRELAWALPVLAAGLTLKAGAIVPRMLLMRRMKFKNIAIADVLGSVIGGIVAVVLAVSGAGYWSLVTQLMLCDLIVVALLVLFARPPLPNIHLRELAGHMAFGARVFAGNLVSFASRNVDNIAVGKAFGAAQVGLYSLAYRVLLTPIQMVGLVVTRVLFPAISRNRRDSAVVSSLIVRSTRGISIAAFPLMGLIGVSANESVSLFLGSSWLAAVPVVQILAFTGARQAFTSVNSPVLLGMNRSDLHLRFNIVAAVVQIAGILVGLFWGIVGVAIGYTIAGLLLTPWILLLQRGLVHLPVRTQLSAIVPALHATVWAIVSYGFICLLPWSEVARFALGIFIYGLVFLLCLRVFHQRTWNAAHEDLRAMLGAVPK